MKNSDRWVESVHFKPLKMQPLKIQCSFSIIEIWAPAAHPPIISTSLGRHLTLQRLWVIGGSTLFFSGNPSSLWLLFLFKSNLVGSHTATQRHPAQHFVKNGILATYLERSDLREVTLCWRACLEEKCQKGVSISDLKQTIEMGQDYIHTCIHTYIVIKKYA